MRRKHTVDQLLAAADDPRYATVEGRVHDELLRTVADVAQHGRHPGTVLGALIFQGRFSSDPLTEGKSLGEIAAAGHFDPTVPLYRGQTIEDVLADFVDVGLVGEVGPTDPIDRLLEPEKVPFIPYYRVTFFGTDAGV